jgi:hypothetical protein
MGTPNTQNIVVVRGDDDDKIITFPGVDVADFDDAWFTVREQWRVEGDAADSAVVFQAQLSIAGLLPGASSDQLRLPLPHARTATWWRDRYVYDVQVLAGGKITTTQRGQLTMTADATASIA